MKRRRVTCGKCGAVGIVGVKFSPSKVYKGGHDPYCKPCRNKATRVYRRKVVAAKALTAHLDTMAEYAEERGAIQNVGTYTQVPTFRTINLEAETIDIGSIVEGEKVEIASTSARELSVAAFLLRGKGAVPVLHLLGDASASFRRWASENGFEVMT